MVNFPARKVRTADIPLLALPIRRQDERTLACSHQYPYFAHFFLLLFLPCKLTPRKHERAQTVIAQEQASPKQRTTIDWKQNVSEPRLTYSQLTRDSAPQITGQQNRAGNRRP